MEIVSYCLKTKIWWRKSEKKLRSAGVSTVISQFYQIQDLLNICIAALAPLTVGDTVTWRPEAIELYWRSFVRYSVDDSLSLPFIYERNNHTFARCIGCEEIQDPKGTYIFEINYQDWEPMRHHMLSIHGEVTQKF
ncbi:hypothetical protein PRIPAC_91214 [Pristionchus pacificus]|uniref:Uncharacterized protein n=1 Tax=Pristionchus pacificus TaxID=54126 RepID=A0A2A6B6Q9_PRIPA|nr:hypothetical protein PRIPAC_91214 [Pristionchus pacificus]|eukprot:PDM61565.1 hypothetical protein PRIPAC_51007 [Pristionchus pacificus]